MKKNEKGFTLVELMIVVAIIAILAAVALPAFGSQIKKSKDGKAVQMMGSMRSQLGMITADLDGANPGNEAATLNALLKPSAGTAITVDGVTATSKGIQGFEKVAEVTGAGVGNLKAGKCGTAAYVLWGYNNTDGVIKFTNTDTDTKGNVWASY